MCQRSSNHKLKAIHNLQDKLKHLQLGVSKIVKSQIESNSQQMKSFLQACKWCVKDRQITNWKQFTTLVMLFCSFKLVCQRSSNHKLKAIHNVSTGNDFRQTGVSKIVKSQIESNSQHAAFIQISDEWCVKDRQITNWKQFTTLPCACPLRSQVCQRSSNHKLKAIHNHGVLYG